MSGNEIRTEQNKHPAEQHQADVAYRLFVPGSFFWRVVKYRVQWNLWLMLFWLTAGAVLGLLLLNACGETAVR